MTFCNERGKRTYIITAKRMTLGLVLKCLNEESFDVARRHETAVPHSKQIAQKSPHEKALTSSGRFPLTTPEIPIGRRPEKNIFLSQINVTAQHVWIFCCENSGI